MHINVNMPTPSARRIRVFSALCGMLILLAQAALGQEDMQGIFPPASKDHSLSAIKIRDALRAKDLVSANVEAEKLIVLAPKDFEGYFWRGFVEFQQHKYGDAVLSLRQAQMLDGDAHVIKLLGLSYYFLGQFRLFVGTMQQSSEKEPTDFAPYYYLGRYYASTDATDFPKATRLFEAALQRNPDHYPSHYYLGYCEETERRSADAEQEYLRAIELADAAGQPFALPNQGMARLKLLSMKPIEALPFASKAVSLDSKDPAGHEVLARVYADLHRRDKAIVEWERTAELDPTNPTPLYRLYRLYLELGKKQKSDQAFANYKALVAMYGSN